MIAITRGKRLRALGIILYGPEGIGKTTMASEFPQPVFIDLEHGSDQMDVARTNTPTTFDEVIALLDALKDEPEFKTVVIDTADRLEQIIIELVCKEHNASGIEKVDGGYGKGYTYVAEKYVKVLRKCGELIDAGKNVVFVAHAQMRKFEAPESDGAYDRWELKLASKKAGALLKEWSDMVLFLNYKTTIITDQKTKSQKGKGGKRVMYATHHPAWDAKNRFGLPDEMDMEFSQIAHIFGDIPVKKSKRQEIKEALEREDVSENQVIFFLRVQQPMLQGDTIDDLEPKIIDFIYSNLTKLINKLKENKANE